MSRRIERINRTVRDTVSDVIQTQLADPRIKGLISVTRVDTSADLSVSRVYLSVMGVGHRQERISVDAVRHARGFIQARLANVLNTRNCPTLQIFHDDSLKKGFEVLQLIDQVATEFRQEQPQEDESADGTEAQADPADERRDE